MNLVIHGGKPLNGRVIPSANKNAVLPVLCSSLLTQAPLTLRNVPDITDVRKLLDFFRQIGSAVEADFSTGVVHLEHHGRRSPQEVRLPEGMRSSVMLIPPLLHRFGEARLHDDTKGCSLGMREIDPHVDVFRAFGASVSSDAGGVSIHGRIGSEGVRHWLDYASVTTTENFVMCAAAGLEVSELINAACEPHVQEFCHFLSMLGVDIEGLGTSSLKVRGPREFKGGEYTFVEDFHEAATFLALGAVTGGTIEVKNSRPDQFQLLDRTFRKFGVEVEHSDGWSSTRQGTELVVQPSFTPYVMQKVEAAPWPYVPADLLPIFIALGVCSKGSVLFWNKVYEGALGWTSELTKFGAMSVTCDPHRVITYGGAPLSPAEVESPYIIRVAIALLMITASIPGRSLIRNADPIRRAHPGFVENLKALGADVEWI